jgi:hypothetical protein
MKEKERLDLLRFCLDYKKKLSIEFIMSYLEFKTHNSFQSFLSKNKIRLSDYGYIPEVHKRVIELSKQGKSAYEIARLLKKPKQSIYYVIKKYKIKKRDYKKYDPRNNNI